MIFGNLRITQKSSTVELTLLTEVKGRPKAIFTYAEIPKLISLLRENSKPEENWRDLI